MYPSDLSQEKLLAYGQPEGPVEEAAVEVLLSEAVVGLVGGVFTEVVKVVEAGWLVVVKVLVVVPGQAEPAQLLVTEDVGGALGDEELTLDVVEVDSVLEVVTVEALGLAEEEPLEAPGLDGFPLRSAGSKMGVAGEGFEQL